MPYKNKEQQRRAVREAQRRYVLRHPERVRISKAKYYRSHKEQINAARRRKT